MAEPQRFAAVDLGAESGRVVAGHLAGGRVELEEVRRFPNRPVRLPDGLHWDVLALFAEASEGIAAAGPLAGVGVDAWGCDYGLLDRDGALLGPPFHYRDARTEGMEERALGRAAREEIYAATGIQFLAINTLNQLLAAEGSAALEAAERLLLMPDLVAAWLTGARVPTDATIASTTQLLDAGTGDWAWELIDRLGIPRRLFGPVVEPGALLGEHRGAPVYAVGGHDTASAVAAVPAEGEDFAYISSGTWSLVGMELPAPVLSPEALGAGVSNERGIGGTTRLLRNVMGLWLLQECRRAWERDDYGELAAMAASAADGALFDPDDPALLRPGDMPARIAAACARAGERPPDGPAETVRAILLSLACKYRFALERVEAVAGREASVVHVVGGGARNAPLCQLTADLLARPVLAGPAEATALGNVMVQALAAGRVGSLAELRAVVRASVTPTPFEPRSDRGDAYERFLAVLRVPHPEPVGDPQ